MINSFLTWMAEFYRPRELYTSNWLGHGFMSVSRYTEYDGVYQLSVDIHHVVGKPLVQLEFAKFPLITFYLIWPQQGTKYIHHHFDLTDPESIGRIEKILDRKSMINTMLYDDRLSLMPEEGFKPVKWLPTKFDHYP